MMTDIIDAHAQHGTFSTDPPKAVIHFVGGAFVGAAPQLSYRLLLESLAAKGLYVSHTYPCIAQGCIPPHVHLEALQLCQNG